ncbi:hypothetical protein [Nocardiopsis suaedae]|uniref:Antitoxin n=1 Tax=Nocardiopsis suaedae TaxID=3018444 RepID=A0ABT4TEV3_9ACTN|nr:hypothetical protein [Nocardiopsis suaedae]MDA2803242.1 hypothetical protein [Nocardiopsis suaedae]
MEAGGNTGELHSKSQSSQTLAESMKDLGKDFDDVLQNAKEAAVEPEFKSGFDDFDSMYRAHVDKVEDQGEQLAENIGSAGREIEDTDTETEDEYQGAAPGGS